MWRSIVPALAFLAVNVFWIGPQISRIYGEIPGNLSYILLRVLILIGLSFALKRFHRKSRYQAISMTVAVGFIDHAVFKAVLLWSDRAARPEAWIGVSPTTTLFGLLMSFIMFAPILILFSFVGTALASIKPRPSASVSGRESDEGVAT